MINSVIVFGDTIGIPQILRTLSNNYVCGIVAAKIRPHQHKYLQVLAEEYKLKLLIQPSQKSQNYSDFIENIYSLNPDLILVNSYSMLLPPEILAIPNFGAINIHAALLPQYRGCNPIQWALLNNETETGVTMHYMNAEFDAGNIICQRRIPIFLEDTWCDIQKRIADTTELILIEELPKILNNTNSRTPQDEAKACYYKRRHPEDGLISWQENVIFIYNLVRALIKPHPGAFYYSESNKVVLDEYLSIAQIAKLKYTERGHRLTSDNLTLTPLTLVDLPKIINFANSLQESLFDAPYKPSEYQQHQVRLEEILQRKDTVKFSVSFLKSNEQIGLCAIHSINYVNNSAELQIRLGKISEHNYGYITEVMHLLLQFAFNELNLQRVYLHIFSSNAVAVHIYEKLGFVREGVLRQAAYINGQYIDILLMGILRGEYVGR